MRQKNDLVTFIAITFSLSILLSLSIGLTGGRESKFIWMGFTSMPIPAFAVLIISKVFKAPVQDLAWNNFSICWLLLALFLMPLVIHVVCLPLMILLKGGHLPWQAWLTPNKEGLYNSPDNLGWGTLTLGEVIFKVVINAVIGVIVVSLLAFLEEIGWRAWMLPRLINRFDVKKGVFIGAVIWALWHVPFMLSGILYVKGIPEYLVLLMNPFGIIGAGIVLSWFWLRTKSIWIVSIAHGALNNWGQYAFKYMQDNETNLRLQQGWLFIGVNVSLLVLGLLILTTMKISNGE
jgi:membrane protease YdiL (CAAX protease family)